MADSNIIDRTEDALNRSKSLNTFFVAVSGLGACSIQGSIDLDATTGAKAITASDIGWAIKNMMPKS